jgi:pimeloyl-ACP methyl ester carboxylesterase
MRATGRTVFSAILLAAACTICDTRKLNESVHGQKMVVQNPVIVVPGITATSLVDDYPLRTDELWSMVLNKEYARTALHPDDLRYEAIEPAHVVPRQLFPLYDDLIKSLRYELSARADKPTPVFAYPYDWRMDIAVAATRLGTFVDEVLARTRLLQHYGSAAAIKVDLVGHSMGGLLICEYLSQFGRRAKVGKVVTIGTPFSGSIEAIVKMTTGMSLLTGGEPKEREREAARVTPALYQLLPSFDGAVVDNMGDAVDIFDPDNMQPSVVKSLTEFVRLYSADTRSNDRENKARAILANLLGSARRHRQTIEKFRTARAGMKRSEWLAIAGAGQKTRIQMTVRQKNGQPRFEIDEDQYVNELGNGDRTSLRTGDGTVPLTAAIPAFLPRSGLVCVTEDDLALFELRDRFLVEVGGFHGLLPRVNLVQRLVAKHLQPKYAGETWGRRLPGVSSWRPPISGLAERQYS